MARLYRRVCILRARGEHAAADRLMGGEVADAIAALQIESPGDATREMIDEVFAAEEERVANASLLAEMLAPLLAEQLNLLQPAKKIGAASPPSSLPGLMSADAAASRGSGTIPDIAGFIDEMIALERRR